MLLRWSASTWAGLGQQWLSGYRCLSELYNKISSNDSGAQEENAIIFKGIERGEGRAGFVFRGLQLRTKDLMSWNRLFLCRTITGAMSGGVSAIGEF